MFILFDVLFTIYFILYLPLLFFRGKWHDGFLERFGFFSPGLMRLLSQGSNIWLHTVSVGEAAAMEGVIAGLRAQFPEKRIVLTVTTKTGYSFAQRKFSGQVTLLWSPLDLSMTVDHFVRIIRPVIYIAAETELWPNLFSRLSRDKVPLLVVNGRISDKAFSRYCWVKGMLRTMLRQVDLFAMQSELDARRIIELGADPRQVTVIGNVKFDVALNKDALIPRDYGCQAGHIVWVAGSTHPGEEEIILDVLRSVMVEYPEMRLVLVPRHPERASAVAGMVSSAGFRPVLFSSLTGYLADKEVMVVDTIGHLLEFYSLASLVFVGKSLTAKGGHNIIEPALFAKPVIIGPNMQNFRDITQVFLSEKAIIQVPDARGLKEAVLQLLADVELRKNLGQKALMVVRRNRGATQRVIDCVAGRVKS